MIFSASCTTFKPHILADISFEKDRCRVRCYDMNNFKTIDDNKCGAHFKSGNYPLDECEGVAGFYLEDVAKEIIPTAKKIKKECKRWR